MTTNLVPFATREIYLTELRAKRTADVPDNYTVNVAIGVQMGLRHDRMVEINLEIATPEDNKPVTFSAKVVGYFKAPDDFAFPDAIDDIRAILDQFVSERAVSVLWAYADFTIRHMLTSLGANVVKILPEMNTTSIIGTSVQAPLPSTEPS